MKSIIEKDGDRCWCCGYTKGLEEHHIFGGPNRWLSEKYGLKVHLCYTCHRSNRGAHFNADLRQQLHEAGQRAFVKQYPTLSFREIFGKNYLPEPVDKPKEEHPKSVEDGFRWLDLKETE